MSRTVVSSYESRIRLVVERLRGPGVAWEDIDGHGVQLRHLSENPCECPHGIFLAEFTTLFSIVYVLCAMVSALNFTHACSRAALPMCRAREVSSARLQRAEAALFASSSVYSNPVWPCCTTSMLPRTFVTIDGSPWA